MGATSTRQRLQKIMHKLEKTADREKERTSKAQIIEVKRESNVLSQRRARLQARHGYDNVGIRLMRGCREVALSVDLPTAQA